MESGNGEVGAGPETVDDPVLSGLAEPTNAVEPADTTEPAVTVTGLYLEARSAPIGVRQVLHLVYHFLPPGWVHLAVYRTTV